ncbi:Pesticin receptor (plasmid) [Sphingobium sp. AntQ-1]|nr:Pesticin receptor [Sphingobium sp. AntQ-1]
MTDVPIAITAVTSNQLSGAGVAATQQLGQVVPGLRLDLSGGFSQPTLRGVGSSVAGAGLNASVATYVDGFYRPSQLSNNFDIADVESIQVLKGPQGTLFGKNATGGAILVTTLEPTFIPSLDVKLSYGRFNEIRTSAVASTGITDTLAVGFSVQHRRSDGFQYNLFTGRNADTADNWNARAKLLFKPTYTLSFLLTYEHTSINDNSSATYSAYRGYSLANDPAVVEALLPGTPLPVVIPQERGIVNLNAPLAFRVNADGITLRSRLELEGATVTSYTGYRDEKVLISQDYDATDLTLFHGVFPPEEKTFSQELNVASNGSSPLQYVAGLFYYNDKSRYPSYLATFNGAAPLNVFDATNYAVSYAAFLDGTYNFNDKIYLTLGARYSIDKLRDRFAAFPPAPYDGATRTFRAFTPRAVLRYAIDQNTSIYASASRGNKSGVFNATGFSKDAVEPEQINAFEVGFKMSRPGVRFETSAFMYNFKNLQVNRFTNTASILVNAAKARIYGGDFQLSVKVAEPLRIELGGAYTHARYQDFSDAPTYLGTGFPGDPIRTASVDARNFQMTRAPDWTGNAAITYETDLGGGRFLATASYYRTSHFYFDAGHQTEQKGYGLMAARVNWTTPDGHLTVGVYGENLTDTKYLAQVLQEPQAILQQYGTPRTYGVALEVKF